MNAEIPSFGVQSHLIVKAQRLAQKLSQSKGEQMFEKGML